MPDTDSADSLGLDWKSRGERAQARQREQQVEAFAGEHLPLSKIEPILVALAGTVQGILAGIPDALRSAGIEGEAMRQADAIIADSLRQVADQLTGIADQATQEVEEVEDAIEAGKPLDPLSGPAERKARRPRGLGKPKHGGRKSA